MVMALCAGFFHWVNSTWRGQIPPAAVPERLCAVLLREAASDLRLGCEKPKAAFRQTSPWAEWLSAPGDALTPTEGFEAQLVATPSEFNESRK